MNQQKLALANTAITQKAVTLFALLWTIGLHFLTAAEIRLAVVPTEDNLRPSADLLTVALSQQPGISVLERAEIDRVWREQATAAAAGNPN